MTSKEKTPKPMCLAEVPPSKWVKKFPEGLVYIRDVLSNDVRDDAREYLSGIEYHPRWKQYPSLVNYHHISTSSNDAAKNYKKLEHEHPGFAPAVREINAAIKKCVTDEQIPNVSNIKFDSFPVHRHQPTYGLKPHYDNAYTENTAVVGMLTLYDKDDLEAKKKKGLRYFSFVDPFNGYKITVPCKDNSLILFGGEAYDRWMHGSDKPADRPKGAKKEHMLTYSVTMRMQNYCGAGKPSNFVNDAGYKVGAEVAKQVAYERFMGTHVPPKLQTNLETDIAAAKEQKRKRELSKAEGKKKAKIEPEPESDPEADNEPEAGEEAAEAAEEEEPEVIECSDEEEEAVEDEEDGEESDPEN